MDGVQLYVSMQVLDPGRMKHHAWFPPLSTSASSAIEYTPSEQLYGRGFELQAYLAVSYHE